MSDAPDISTPLEPLHEALDSFSVQVTDLRPALHRYVSRMAGNVFDGEDIVQEALSQAYYSLSQTKQEIDLKPWLFKIAHNKAVDFLRKRDRLREATAAYAEDNTSSFSGEQLEPGDELDDLDFDAADVAFGYFLKLPATHRAVVVLKDVLEYSNDEIARILDISLPAAKSALHRGRVRLKILMNRDVEDAMNQDREAIQNYVDLFNAREWDSLRDMLAEDVRLHVVNRSQSFGKSEVGKYFGHYDALNNWRLIPVILGDMRLIALCKPDTEPPEPFSLIRVDIQDKSVRSIRDYRYVPYLLQDTPARAELSAALAKEAY